MLLLQRLSLVCVCMSSLVGCGSPIRDLTNVAKELIPDKAKETPGCSAEATTRIALIANLYADAPLAASWDPARPEARSTFIVSGSPFTGDGHVVDLRLYFAKRDERTWQWHALATNAGSPHAELGTGTLTFDETGALESAVSSTTLRLPRLDGSLSAPVELWLGTPVGADADGFDGVTSTPEPSGLDSYEQDGRARLTEKECSAS